MGICFVGQKGDFGDFLSKYLSDDQQKPGRMLSIEQYIELMHIHLQQHKSALGIDQGKLLGDVEITEKSIVHKPF
eukprot:UN05295